MKNPLLDELPTLKIDGIDWINAQECERIWREAGQKPEHLAEFLKKYPAGYRIGWIQGIINRWFLHKRFDDLKKLHYSKGQDDDGFGLRQVAIDFLIYLSVKELLDAGYRLTSNSKGPGACAKLEEDEKIFFNVKLKETQIRERYSRFKKMKPARFIDGRRMICGPSIIEKNGGLSIGIWDIAPE